MQNEKPLVNWREAERLAWLPESDREIALDLARVELQTLQHELEAAHGRVQVIGRMLELSKDGPDGSKTAD